MNITHQQMNDKKGRQIATIEAFNVVEERVKELNAKLIEAKKEKKSTEATLERAER